jgi:hypothetical protein
VKRLPGFVECDAGKLYVADSDDHLICVVDLRSGDRVPALTLLGLPPVMAGTLRVPSLALFRSGRERFLNC